MATRSEPGRRSRVFSSRVVLPDPGELIRFTTSTRCSRKRSRNSAATRAFSFRTFPSIGTRFIFFHLQIGKLQFVPADDLGVSAAAGGTEQVEIADLELAGTLAAAAERRAVLDVEREALHFGFESQRFKGKAQRIG